MASGIIYGRDGNVCRWSTQLLEDLSALEEVLLWLTYGQSMQKITPEFVTAKQPCPFCSGEIHFSLRPEAAFHTMPPCKVYLENDALDFIKKVTMHLVSTIER